MSSYSYASNVQRHTGLNVDLMTSYSAGYFFNFRHSGTLVLSRVPDCQKLKMVG